jgi:sarcosine oxidase subunit gamma
VPDSTPILASALDGVATPGRYGRSTAVPGVTVTEMRGVGLASITARAGKGTALLDAAQAAFGVALPGKPRRAEGHRLVFIWSGPDQWLACCNPAPAEGMEARLAAPLAGLASVVDQSHGRTLLRVAGPHVRDALTKGVAVDLHPRAFKAGDAAVTMVAHVPVHFWQIDDRPTYEIAVARSLAQSFWRWLEESSAQYGLEFADR